MRLRDLLKYETIVIQCHDNPDADAVASGFGLYTYFKKKAIMREKKMKINVTKSSMPDFKDIIGHILHPLNIFITEH